MEAHDGTVTVLRGGSQGPGDQVMQRQSQDKILEVNQEGLRDPSCCVGGWVWKRDILEDLSCSYGHWVLTDHKCVLCFPSPLLSPDNNLKTKDHRGEPSGRVEDQLCTRRAVVASLQDLLRFICVHEFISLILTTSLGGHPSHSHLEFRTPGERGEVTCYRGRKPLWSQN